MQRQLFQKALVAAFAIAGIGGMVSGLYAAVAVSDETQKLIGASLAFVSGSVLVAILTIRRSLTKPP